MENLNPRDHLEFLKRLLDEKIIVVGPLTKLKDGSMSPIYVNLRDKMWDSHGLIPMFGVLFATLISELISERRRTPNYVCGIPEAANPLATAAVYAGQGMGMDLRLRALRPEPKNYGIGSGSLVIGNYEEGGHLYLIDDVVTTSKSKREASKKLITGGYPQDEITVLVAFDRQQGGMESLRRDGFRTGSLFRILDVAQTFAEEHLITEEQHADVQRFIAEHQQS
ncbi:MAG: hypothetical protein WCT27_00755 [Patescibacteria group bacterium]